MNAWLESPSGINVPIQGLCSIGRSSQNTLALDQPSISRRHALIQTQSSGEHWLVDLGSSNGVVLNGKRVRQPVGLQDGDHIQVGDVTLTFRQPEKPAVLKPTSRDAVTVRKSRTVQTWLVMADLEGSTEMSTKLDPEELAQTVGKWFLKCKELVELGGGVINKYLGDGFLAWWPEDNASPQGVQRVLTSFKALQSASRPCFRWVCHFGTIRVDNMIFEGEDSLIGSEVNFVFRMEKLARALGRSRLLSQAAVDRLRPKGNLLTHEGQHRLNSFEGSFDFYSWG